jgi:hypothetical protein
MNRDEAESEYVAKIMAHGNPAYFVWSAVRNMSNEDLIYEMNGMQIDIDEIEDEE